MIKKFENFKEEKYKIGDYVLLDKYHKWTIDLICEIIDINYDDDLEKNSYRIRTTHLSEINSYHVLFWIKQNEIEKKLSSEEIEQYKIEKYAKKYNL